MHSYLLCVKTTEDEKLLIRKSAENLRANQGCNARGAELIEGTLDGYWPDFPGSRRSTWVSGWNTAEVDEQGPVGLFAATIDRLRANKNYKFEITPIFSSNFDSTSPPTIIEARTASTSARITACPCYLLRKKNYMTSFFRFRNANPA